MSYIQFDYPTDNLNHVHRYLTEPILSILSSNPKRRILDIGCGNGWLTKLLVKNGFDAYGTDASLQGIEIAKQQYPDRFYLQDLTKEDLPEQLREYKFDTIISTEVVEHLYAPREYFDFCKKILLKSGGGELIVSTPYHGYLKNVVLSVSGKMDEHFTTLWDGGHIKFWSVKSLSKVLEEKGFRNIKFKGCGRLPFLWKSMIITCTI